MKARNWNLIKRIHWDFEPTSLLGMLGDEEDPEVWKSDIIYRCLSKRFEGENMKLKEKLAEKYAETETYCDARFTAKKAFIAGFDQAKKLLRAMEPYKQRRWFEIPMYELDMLGEDESDPKV